jgi:hypothetical protein
VDRKPTMTPPDPTAKSNGSDTEAAKPATGSSVPAEPAPASSGDLGTPASPASPAGRVSVRSQVWKWLGNPAVGFAGVCASVAGVILCIVFYRMTIERRDLSYAVHPAKALLAAPAADPELAVTYRGRPVAADISVIQVAVWNAGKKPIKREDVLEPLVFRPTAGALILNARLRAVSRGVVGLTAKQMHLKDNALAVEWRILEENDGVAIQFIVAGSRDVDIAASAVLEGQRAIRRVAHEPPPSVPVRVRPSRWMGLLFLVLGAVLISSTLWRIIRGPDRRRKLTAELVPTALLVVFVAYYYFFYSGPERPPFAFWQ